jgi:hypothetical protein
MRFELGDELATSVEVTYRRNGRHVTGAVRSRAGGARFELELAQDQITFRHPMTGARGELGAAPLTAGSAEVLNHGASNTELAAKVARIARRLEHVSVLQRVEMGFRERRDTLPLMLVSQTVRRPSAARLSPCSP